MASEQLGTGAMIPLMVTVFVGAPSFIWPLTPAESLQLPPCQPVTQTVSLEKEGCPRCHTVETTICSGYCKTKDPVIKTRFLNKYQHVCTYQEFYYKTVELPDCLPGIDPTVSYPVAVSCNCDRCSLNTSDCTFESLQPDFCVNAIPFYY